MNLIISDICGTLVLENTTRGFLAWLSRQGVRPLEISTALSRPVSWLSTRSGADLSRRWLIWALRGLDRHRLQEEADAYVSEALSRTGRSMLLQELRHRREMRDELLLASATIDPIAGAFARRLGARASMSSRLDFDERDVCRGRLAEDLTGRKWAVLEPVVASLRPAHTTVYTDNSEDRDVMLHADRVFFYGRPSPQVEYALGPGRLTLLPREVR